VVVVKFLVTIVVSIEPGNVISTQILYLVPERSKTPLQWPSSGNETLKGNLKEFSRKVIVKNNIT